MGIILSISDGARRPIFHYCACGSGSKLRDYSFGRHSLGQLRANRVMIKKLCKLGHFRPNGVGCGHALPGIVFANFRLFGRSIGINGRCTKHIVLGRTLGRARRIILTCGRGIFAILFTSSGFILPRGARCFCGLRKFGRG